MPPVTVPVKKTPKISDVLQDPVLVSSSSMTEAIEQSQENAENPTLPVDQADAASQEEADADVPNSENPIADDKQEISEVSEDQEKSTGTEAMDTPVETEEPAGGDGANQALSSSDEKFASAWNTMFELLFREIATIYYPLKGVVPSIKNNIIHVKVKNEMMKDNFESRVRLALEYLRNNFDQRIDDIQVEVEVNPAQTSKLIYDTQDKMNDLNKENPDLPEFLKILNLSAKDM